MLPFKVIYLLTFAGLLGLSTVTADSAGIVEMVNGLAYGGIPYGSVSGMVAKYPGFTQQQLSTVHASQLTRLVPVQPLFVGHNSQTANLVTVRAQQIYNPSVINLSG